MKHTAFDPEKLREELKVLRDIRNISSGTIAMLIQQSAGKVVRDYETLAKVQWAWADWAQDQSEGFKNWREAWEAWVPNNLQGVLGKEGQVMSKLLRVCQMIEDPDSKQLNAGFAIYTPPQGTIEDNFSERRDREPTAEEWKQINRDVATIERNVVNYLDKFLNGARDEGHSGDSLIGSCWCNWDNKKGLELIRSNLESEGHQDLSHEEQEAFFKGVSEIGESALDVDLYFFDISKEDLERLEMEVANTI